MRLISLNLNQEPVEGYEAQFMCAEPWFPYRWQIEGLVHNGFLQIEHTHKDTRRSANRFLAEVDPYVGEQWVLRAVTVDRRWKLKFPFYQWFLFRLRCFGKEPYIDGESSLFEIKMSDLVCWTVEVTVLGRRLYWSTKESGPLHRLFSGLFNALEFRREWFYCNKYEPDPMGNLSDYE